MDDKDQEIKIEHTLIETAPLQPMVTAKYVYYYMKDFWGHVTFRHGQDDVKTGLAFAPMQGGYILVAFPRPGKAGVTESLRDDAITLEEFQQHWQQMTLLMKMSRETYSAKNEGF